MATHTGYGRRRPAFTLFEMLAATALSAALMLAVFAVLASLGRGRAAMQRQSAAPAWREDLLDTLRHDLANATAVRYDPGGLTLTGHAAFDHATMAVAHEPAVVTYGVAGIRSRHWLYRRQSPAAGFDGPAPWTELLCPDVSGLTVRPVAGPLPGAPPPAAGANEGPSFEPVPASVTVRLDGPDGQGVEETLVIR